MPQDIKDYLPDLDTALEQSDRRLAERKYRDAVLDADAQPSEPRPEGATPSPAIEPPGRPRIVAEPPPATVSIPKPSPPPARMPRWKVAVLAVTFCALPAAAGILAVRHLDASRGGPRSGSLAEMTASPPAAMSTLSVLPSAPAPQVDATATSAPEATTVPSAEPSSTASAGTAGTASGTRPAPKRSGDPNVDPSALPKATAEPAPSTAPVVTAAPSAVPAPNPSAPRTNPWDDVFEKKKESASQ